MIKNYIQQILSVHEVLHVSMLSYIQWIDYHFLAYTQHNYTKVLRYYEGKYSYILKLLLLPYLYLIWNFV